MRTVAVLGTGTMGEPIARNLLHAGFDVRVWNRTRERAEPLGRDGATVCDSAPDAARGAELVLTMLPDADVIAEAIADVEFDDGAIWIQMATVGLTGVERLARIAEEKGVAFVDSPVLGTRQPAEEGALTVVASGPDDALDRCAALFDAVGHKTVLLGPVPNGSKLKLVVNLWLLAITEGAAEALALAEGLGLDPQTFLDAIAGGATDVPYVHMKGEEMVNRRFGEASFKLRHAAKDARLALEAAKDVGIDTRLAAAVDEAFQHALALGHGDEDMAAVFFAVKPD